MNQAERKVMMDLFKREYSKLEQIKINCGTCEHTDGRGWCCKYEANVPKEVLPVGCEGWEYDWIPF